jgi:endonuclease-3
MGLTTNDNPEKVEIDLMKIVDKKDWFRISNVIIEHGRGICKAIKPGCDVCFISKICPKVGIPGN